MVKVNKMLDYSIPIGGLSIKSGSLYGAADGSKARFKIQNSVLRIDTPKSGETLADKLAGEKSGGSLAKNFEATLLSHLVTANSQLDEKKKHSEAENKALVQSVVEVVDEVKDKFGTEEGNRLMAKILLNTEAGVTENRVVAAVSDFFLSIRDSALSAYQKVNASEESTTNADSILKKLGEIVVFLNEGVVDDAGEGKEEK
jgi:hypothetical protein